MSPSEGGGGVAEAPHAILSSGSYGCPEGFSVTRVVPYNEKDLDVLARTLYGEARGETLEGLLGVAWVVCNRVLADSWYGDTVAEVCLKPLQFSCWNADDPNLPLLKKVDVTVPAFARCYGAAALVLSGEFADHTGGATNYHTIRAPKWAKSWPPLWALKMVETVRIHRHVFYREAA